MTVRSSVAILVAVFASVFAAACSEHLNGGAACASLCPGQKLVVTDTTFRIDHSSPVYDTTVASYPQLGDEGTLLIANIPNRADVRGMLRFDSLAITFSHTVADTTAVTYSTVARNPALVLYIDTHNVTTTRGSDRIQFNLYDVDNTADTVVSGLLPQFTNAHLIGKSTPQLASALRDTTNSRSLDTILVHLDSVFVLSKIQGDRKLRFGIVAFAVNNPSDAVRLTIDEQNAPVVRYYGTPDSVSDTTYGRIASQLRSSTPVNDSSLLGRLVHFPLVVKGAIPDSVTSLNIGGMPARRVFLRFGLPSRIIDTANVLRATLLLTPKPLPLQIPGDTVVLYPQPVVSSNKVMTPAEAANFVVSSSVYGIDSAKVIPSATAQVPFDFVNAVHNWQNVPDSVNTRALVLRILNEGGTSLESSFWSSYAPDTALRPHVRIQYVKRSGFGVP